MYTFENESRPRRPLNGVVFQLESDTRASRRDKRDYYEVVSTKIFEERSRVAFRYVRWRSTIREIETGRERGARKAIHRHSGRPVTASVAGTGNDKKSNGSAGVPREDSIA